MEHIIQFALIAANAVLTLVVTYTGWKLKEYHDAELARERKENARDQLQLSTSRIILIRECNHYIKKGFAPIYAVDSIAEMYEAYHAFGGNGAVTSIYQEFLNLPHTPPAEG